MVLLHELPDGTSHFDWLIQRSGDPNAPLAAFRTVNRPDDPLVRQFSAERLADHRAIYLDFEGEIGGGRGRVSRVATGMCTILGEARDAIEIELRFDAPARLARGSRTERDLWHFSVE